MHVRFPNIEKIFVKINADSSNVKAPYGIAFPGFSNVFRDTGTIPKFPGQSRKIRDGRHVCELWWRYRDVYCQDNRPASKSNATQFLYVCACASLSATRARSVSLRRPMGVNSSREPQPMCFHAAVDFRQKLYIWGGLRLPSMVHNSMLEMFDVPSEKWQQPQTLRGSRLPDDLCAMAVARDSEKAYFFGGMSFSSSKAARDSENPRFFGGVSDSSSNLTFFNTLYQLNLSTLECKELVPRNPSQAPVKQCGSGMVFFKDKLVVQGGYTGKDCSNELYTFDLKNSECEESNLCSCSCMYHTHLYSRLDHALQDCAVN